MKGDMSTNGQEALGAWLVAALALTALGIVPLVSAREPATGFAIDVVPSRPASLAPAGGRELPFEYDAQDFGDWLSRRGGTPVAQGATDADS